VGRARSGIPCGCWRRRSAGLWGFKSGRWLDQAFYQLLLDTPE
jgi:L-amino acid N-acyltransferase YncA